MHLLFKSLWVLRAFFYKFIFATLNFPSYIGPPIFLMNPSRMCIEKKVRIFPGLRAECHGDGRLFIHSNVSIGQGFHVIASTELHIGSGCLISSNVFITDTDHTYTDISRPVFEQPNIIKKTEVGENCFIGVGARIQAGTILGKGCVVGANAVVRGVFPDYSVIVGAPGRVIKRYNPETSSWERVCDLDKRPNVNNR